MQTITRKGSFDSGHRVMNERMKCFNIHGHTYLYSLTFSFESMEKIGYAVDFKEIKRVCCQWIDDVLDHGMILNPKDDTLILTTIELGSKFWCMSLNGKGEFCNPTVENIAKEVFLAMEVLMSAYPLKIHRVKMYETPNCYTVCKKKSISDGERERWMENNFDDVMKYSQAKGVVEYDATKIGKPVVGEEDKVYCANH